MEDESEKPPVSFSFAIGPRTYFVARDNRRGNGWCIIYNGDLVEFVSSNHFGDIGAFFRIAARLGKIEATFFADNPS